MVHLPVRKCYHILKVCLLIVLVTCVLSLFEHWRGGKRSVRGQQQYSNSEDYYEKQILEDEQRIVPGLGEGGEAVHLEGKDKQLGEESEKKLAMNVYLSDRISYNRTLEDHRNPACKRVKYDSELPSASVILIFHNEPYSVVVRTIWSVINSVRRTLPWYKDSKGYPGQDPTSPFVFLKEIILVDDNSTLPELKGKLSHYVRTRLPPDLIKILRLPDRMGLIAARTYGARAARGSVLVFLDAHCETERDWLRPLIQRVKHKRDAVVTPLIDVVDQTTFELQAAEHFQVGGFTFMGHFTWIDVPEREKKRRGSDISPTWSPTMAGGLLAIDRHYYWELGAYDEQMAGWGGENLEMSFRVWQCGGTLETIPCSRVGHVFRSFHPYGLPANSDTHGINTARMAEVWMDDYAELFYLHRPDLRNNPKIGDVTHRKILREKLQCKSFSWYLQHVYSEKFVPVRDVQAFGRFKNPSSGLCLDTLQRESESAPLGVYLCHSKLQATQYLSLSLTGELRDEERCAEVAFSRSEQEGDEDQSRRVLMSTCHGKPRQKWRRLSTSELQHISSGLCLTAPAESGSDVRAAPCRRRSEQLWTTDYSDWGKANDTTDMTDQEIKLLKLRGLRRKSRSLLSIDDGPMLENRTDTRRSHSRHKKHKKQHSKKHARSSKTKTKNKFILKLVRTLMDHTEEHLEMDIYCKHRPLYPNNSFVRDLVAILNDRNIKVINNGRVFERNRVTDLSHSSHDKVLQKMELSDPMLNDDEKPSHGKKHTGGKGAGQGSGRAGDRNRIIIEDFVELTTRSARGAQYRDKKRPRHTSSTSHKRRPATPRDSLEDFPMSVERDRRGHDNAVERDSVRSDDWELGEFSKTKKKDDSDIYSTDHEESRKRYETKNSLTDSDLDRDRYIINSGADSYGSERDGAMTGSTSDRDGNMSPVNYDGRKVNFRARDDDGEISSELSPVGGATVNATQAPVQVRLHSNVTFDLGDTFFERRSDDSPGELTIPTNSTDTFRADNVRIDNLRADNAQVERIQLTEANSKQNEDNDSASGE